MQFFLYLAVAFIGEVSVHAADPEFDQQGLIKDCGNRVANHNPDGLGDYPWLVKLLYNEPKITRCGGVLLTDEWVLSTAKCLRQDELQAVMVGKYDTSDDWDCLRIEFEDIPQRVLVHKIIFHPEHDVGLINLNNGVRMNNYVNTICLPFDDNHVGPGMFGRVAGWSHLDKCLKLYNDQLKSAYLMVLHNTECEQLMNTTIKPVQFCAKPVTRQKPCVAMPGGPFMALQYGKHKNDGRFHVAGIMLEEDIECDTINPLIFIDISYVRTWITDIIRKPTFGGMTNERTSTQRESETVPAGPYNFGIGRSSGGRTKPRNWVVGNGFVSYSKNSEYMILGICGFTRMDTSTT